MGLGWILMGVWMGRDDGQGQRAGGTTAAATIVTSSSSI